MPTPTPAKPAAAPAKGASIPAAKPAAKPAVKGAGRGRKSPYAGKRIFIHKDHKENPYRENSIRFSNWKKIKEGMTHEEYVKAGGDAFCLKYGEGRGHLMIK